MIEMSRDLKNSILLWAGTLAVFGLFWAWLHFGLGPDIPDQWVNPILGILIALNVLGLVLDHFRKRHANVR